MNVPVDVQKIFKTIPINQDNLSIIDLEWKRKECFTHSYQKETIRRRIIFEAAKVLIQTPLYIEHEITIDEEYDLKTERDIARTEILTETNEESVEREDDSDEEEIPQETLLDDRDGIAFAPGENQTPLSILFDTDAEELSFPSVYGGHGRQTTLNYRNIVKS